MNNPKVLNKHKPSKGPKNPRGTVNVMRGTKWGNPYPIEEGVLTREESLAKFKEYLKQQPELVRLARIYLAGRDLECCCDPLPCHAHLWLAVSNSSDRYEKILDEFTFPENGL